MGCKIIIEDTSAVILLRKDRVRGHLKSGMEKESQKEGKPEIPERDEWHSAIHSGG